MLDGRRSDHRSVERVAREVVADAQAHRYLILGLERGTEVDRALAHLVSAGIVAFGVWTIMHAMGSGAPLAWTLLGILPLLVGLVSVYHETKVP
jgi:hypothetical protein